MVGKIFVLSLAVVFVLGFGIVNANGDHVEVQFMSNDYMPSESVEVKDNARLAVSIQNRNEDYQVQYSIINGSSSQIINKGVVEPGQDYSFEIPVTAGTYYIQGKSWNVGNDNEIGFMDGEGFASLTVIQ